MAGGVDPAAFRSAMARWPTGVSVVTARHRGTDAGLTVNAFLSVSLRPPTLLISLTHDADTTPMVEASGRFAVNLLAFDQQALSVRFAEAIPPERKFTGVAVARGLADLPLLEGALVHLECKVRSVVSVEDHRLFVGALERVGAVRDAPPLLFYRSQYPPVAADGRAELPTGPR